MTSMWKRILMGVIVFAFASTAMAYYGPQAHAALGDEVRNTAYLSADSDTGQVQIQSNTVVFTIEARSTPSNIEFFRIAPSAPDAISVMLNGSEFSPTGEINGPFQPIVFNTNTASASISMPSLTPIVPTDVYLSGDTIVVRVIDEGQNGDPDLIETIEAVVTTSNGDTITLRLFEDAPDSGQFYAAFPSTADDSAPNDNIISAPQDSQLTATYNDRFDATEVSVDTALVDPFGRIFDSYTGNFIDGVSVTLIDVSTEQPAAVFGLDGVSIYPSTVDTGSIVTDSSGFDYTLDSGEFLFPLVVPGDYRLQIDVPDGYDYPSQRTESELQSLPNAPYELIPGSYGGVFTVTSSGPLNLDVPLDPNGELIITKTVAEPRAAIGDFVGYTITLENRGTTPAPFTLMDEMPRGFRYVSGSAWRDGIQISDPAITANGTTLFFEGGFVDAGNSSELTYLVSVGPGTPEGDAVNTAVAQNRNGEAISNVAEAILFIEEDLFRSKLTIVGRVAEAACRPEDDWARGIKDGKGVAGVRLYMETGRYVVTDENGLYHFEAIEPGTHVVQVDQATLPEGYQPVICEENTRYAGSALSKFVDAQGGTIWRANFYLQKKKAEPKTITRTVRQPSLSYFARPVKEDTEAIADGSMQPRITLEIKDETGKLVEEGRGIKIEVGGEYDLISADEMIGANGRVQMALAATDVPGEVPLKLKLAPEPIRTVTETIEIPTEESTSSLVSEELPTDEVHLDPELIYDEVWLNQQTDPTARWVYPAVGSTPHGRSVNIGVLHGPQDKLKLILNDRDTGAVNFAGRELSRTREVAMSRWTGVDIQKGKNTFVVEVRDQNDALKQRLERTVWFIDEVEKAWLVDDQTVAVADGRTRPVVAVRLEDAAGHAVHAGRIVDITVSEPYRLAQTAEREFEAPVSAAFSTVAGIRVGANGIAHVELEPTLQAGRVRLFVGLENDRSEVIDVWLKPEKREWVVVGLAEAEGLLSKLDGDDGLKDGGSTDGRLAFFAKGMIKGDWLLTMAVDTAKRRGKTDGELFDEIDPSAYYTLYGDRTWQYNDAESRYPVYVKLERNTVQALFGDFETDLTDTELGRYSRRLSGAKVDYQGEQVSVTAFAAETNQTFRKDEIAADGTSGPYRLTEAPLIRSSETLMIETRDRLRPDVVLSLRTLARYIDYEIDYLTGEIIFRAPVDATDASFNPNVIVVDYETAEAGDRGLTAGLRAEISTVDDRIELGVTALREEDATSGASELSELVSVDATVQLNDLTEIRAEVASSQSDSDTGREDADAWLLEVEHRSQKIAATAYYREEGEGFGLGQQSSNTSATRRIGALLSAELGVKEVSDGNDRSVRRLNAQAYHEENLSTDAQRDVVEVSLTQDSQTLGAGIGLKQIEEVYGEDGETRESLLLTAQARTSFVDQGLTLSVSHDQPISASSSDEGNEATLFPQRTILGLDKTLGRRATLNVRHEVSNGDDASGDNTIAGITWLPWAGGEVRALTDRVSSDNGQRIGATVGVDQAWQVNDAWRLSAGLTNRTNISGDDDPRDATADDAISPLEDGVRSALTNSEGYTSAYIGAGYRADTTALGGRIELRDSEVGHRTTVTVGGAREVSETLSFSSAARYEQNEENDAPNTESLDIRLGAAWRSRGEGLVLLNRFDVGHSKVEGQSVRTKAVNNLALNVMPTKQTQLSFYHGLKYVKTTYGGAEASGFTNLLGGEIRHDITPKIDLGLHGYALSGDASGTTEWAFGPSVGFSPAKNVWMSVGYNIKGFEDEDFEAARYTRDGAYIKLRAKFDQDTIKGLIKDLGLGNPE